MSSNRHHPIFQSFQRVQESSNRDFDLNFLSAQVRHSFEVKIEDRKIYGSGRAAIRDQVDQSLPSGDSEDYIEWIDLLESIVAAEKDFVMIEAGAGYGRWLVNAVCAIRQSKKKTIETFRLCGLEPDLQRFQFMLQHLRDNGVDPSSHRIIQAAVSNEEGVFFQGKANHSAWGYGEPLIRSSELDRMAMSISNPELVNEAGKIIAKGVPTLKLSKILKDYEKIDLLDCDLQGEELKVVDEAFDEIHARVKRCHIGTHGKEIEVGLRKIFSDADWVCLSDYSVNENIQTPFGRVQFIDGIQSWINPHLNSPENIGAYRELRQIGA